MRKLARLIFVTAVMVLLGLASWPAHADESGLSLEVASSKPQYAPGEPVELRITVANRGPSACRLATRPDASVQLMSVRRDGEPVSPSFAEGYYGDGLAGAVGRSLREVAPGATVSLTMITNNRSLMTSTASPAGGALVSWWPVDAGGRYDISVGYAVPQLAESGACAGATNVATVSFTVDKPPTTFPWLTVLIVAGAVLIAAIVVIILLRRRRSHNGAAAMVVVVLAAVGIGMIGVTGIARAEYYIPDSDEEAHFKNAEDRKAFEAKLGECFGFFATNDPAGIMPDVKGKSIDDSKRRGPIRIIKAPAVDASSDSFGTPISPDGPNSSTVVFNPVGSQHGVTYQGEPGHIVDDCGALYHELVHSVGIMNKNQPKGECGDTGIDKEELRASYAQNDYLEAQYPGQKDKPRLTYKGKPLPAKKIDPKTRKTATELSDACKRPKKKKQATNACTSQPSNVPAFRMPSRVVRGALDDCTESTAQTNGDPHLATFDQYDYDFQAVGEFVAAKSGNDFEVQTRQGPVPHLDDRTVSVNSAVAMRVGADRVGVYVEEGVLAVRVNGQVETIERGDRTLPGGGVLSRRESFLELAPDGYTVTWPDGSVAELDVIGSWGIRLLLSLSQQKHTGKVTGLLGNFDGNKDNELLTRDGKPVAQPPEFEQLYRTFGDSWRISQAESLFDYKPGESAEKFTDRSFPQRQLTVRDLPEDIRNQARVACELAGVTSPSLLDACILDVALIGQANFAAYAGDTQSILPESQEPAPGPVDPGGTVKDGDVVKGTIDKPGERDSYQLDLGDATEFQFVEQTGDIAIAAETPGMWKRALTTDADEISENSPQAKRIVVSKPDDTTGEYSFRVVTHKHRRFDVKVGDRIDGRLDVPGRVDVYALDPGGAGSIELTDVKGCYYWFGAAEDAPDSSVTTPYAVWPDVLGQQGPPCSSIPLPIEPNKRFLLAVWFPEAKALDYGFRIEAK